MLIKTGMAKLRNSVFIALLCGVRSLEAQEALRTAIASDETARARSQAREQVHPTLHAGHAKVSLSGSLTTEWNSNVTLREDQPLDDAIMRPEGVVRVIWPITALNYFDARLAAGYNKYISHSEFDRPYIDPVSNFAFDVYYRSLRITLEDRFSYLQDAVEQPVVTGTARFGGFQNLAGVRVTGDGKRLSYSISYHHSLFTGATDGFEHLERQSHQFFGRLSSQWSPSWQASLETGATPTDYRQDLLRDNLSYSGGAALSAQLSRHFEAVARGGVAIYDYEERPGAPFAEDRAVNGYYSVELTHRVRKYLTYSAEAGRESQLGVNQDLVELLYARLRGDWIVAKGLGLGAHFFYEDGSESGLLTEEEFSRWGGGAALSKSLGKGWSGRFAVLAAARSSAMPNRSYDSFRALLQVVWQH